MGEHSPYLRSGRDNNVTNAGQPRDYGRPGVRVGSGTGYGGNQKQTRTDDYWRKFNERTERVASTYLPAGFSRSLVGSALMVADREGHSEEWAAQYAARRDRELPE